jgi:hypothetical protein
MGMKAAIGVDLQDDVDRRLPVEVLLQLPADPALQVSLAPLS